MRVVHVINSSGANFLGHERHVLNLAVAQRAHGLDVMVVTNGDGVLGQACQEQRIPQVVIEGMGQGPRVRGAEGGAVRELAEQYTAFGAQIIHCHHLGTAIQAVSAGNVSNIPCVFTLHIEAALFTDYLEMAKRRGMKSSIIAVSRTEFEVLKKSGIPEDELYYVPNGTNPVPSDRRRCKQETGRPRLVFVGNLIFRKGVDVALMVMAELRQRLGSDCPGFDIYGEGIQRKYFAEIASVLGLDDIVRFHVFRLDAMEQHASTDVLLMTSREETGPLVVLEAMSLGMPIVATDVGEVAQMLPDRSHGRVVPPNSIAAFADAVESLLADIAHGKFDPEPVIQRHRSLYSTEKMTESVEEVYQQVLSRKVFA
jgi:glycosyltransferase involved in cell wall biosynthesis